MNCILGIDTSNYKTSVAVLREDGQLVFQRSELLEVEKGKCGLRQSQAYFLHGQRLPEYMRDAFGSLVNEDDVAGVAVSFRPRDLEESYMPVFLAGLQVIPGSLYEAASIDGASNTRQFLTITIPLLGPVLQMVLMNAILGSLKVTDLVLTLTNGKPSGKTEVMMTYIYKKFFGDGGASGLDFGYGAALTVVTAVILGIVTLLYLRATKKSSDVY